MAKAQCNEMSKERQSSGNRVTQFALLVWYLDRAQLPQLFHKENFLLTDSKFPVTL